MNHYKMILGNEIMYLVVTWWIAWAPSRQIGLGCLPLMACTTAFCLVVLLCNIYTLLFFVFCGTLTFVLVQLKYWNSKCIAMAHVCNIENINCRILSGRAIVVGSLIMLLYTKRSSLYAHSCTTPISLSIRIDADGFMTWCAGQCMSVCGLSGCWWEFYYLVSRALFKECWGSPW